MALELKQTRSCLSYQRPISYNFAVRIISKFTVFCLWSLFKTLSSL